MFKVHLFNKHAEKIFHLQAAVARQFFFYSEHIESLNSWQPDCWCALAPSAAAVLVIVFLVACTYIIINTLKNHVGEKHIFYSIWIEFIIRIFLLRHVLFLTTTTEKNNDTIKKIHHIYPNNKTEFRSLLASACGALNFSVWWLKLMLFK